MKLLIRGSYSNNLRARPFQYLIERFWGLFKSHAYPPFKDYTLEGLTLEYMQLFREGYGNKH